MRKEKTGRFARLRVLAERPEIGILIPLLLIMAVTAVINPNFMTAKNFSSVFKSIPFIAVVTLGAAFPLITGNVDISNGRFVGLTGMLFGVFLVNTRLGVAGSIAACLLIGCILRSGKVLIPSGQDTLEPGDSVIVITTITGLSDLRDILEKRKG